MSAMRHQYARRAFTPWTVLCLSGRRVSQRGWAEALAEFAEPPDFLLDVLTCADMTTGPDGSPVRADDRLSEILSRYAEDDPVYRAITLSAPTLLAAVARVDALTG